MATTSPRKAAGRTTGASKPAAGKTVKTATGKTAGKAASGATARATVRAPGSEKSPQRPATAATGTGKNAASRGNGAGKSAKSTGATAPTGTKANAGRTAPAMPAVKSGARQSAGKAAVAKKTSGQASAGKAAAASGKSSSSSSTAGTMTSPTTRSGKTTPGKPAAGTTTARRTTAVKTSTGVARKASTGKSRPAAKPAGNDKGATHRITPEEALSNTRALLAEKQARDHARGSRKDRPYGASVSAPHAGFQSGEARAKAIELHEGEMNLEAVEGNISDRGRRQQGKRDSR